MDRPAPRLCTNALIARFGRRSTRQWLLCIGLAARLGNQDASAASVLGAAIRLFRRPHSPSSGALGYATQIQLLGPA